MRILSNYIENCIPVFLKQTNEDTRKAKTIIYVHLFIIVISFLLFLVNCSGFAKSDFPFLPAVLIFGGSLFLFKYFGSFTLTGNVLAFISYMMLAPLSLKTGGLYSLDFVCMLIIPMIAYMVAGILYGLFWTGAILVFSYCLYYIESNGIIDFHSQVLGLNAEYHLILVSTIFLLVSTLIFIFKKGNELVIEELKEQRALLQNQKRRISDQAEMLEKAQKYLMVKNAELEEFAFVASHDLKEPLRSIKGFSELLEMHLNEKGWMDKDAQECLSFINSGAKNMNQFISDLLSYARFQSKKDCVYEFQTLSSILDLVEKNLFNQIEESGATIEYDELPELYVITVKIKQLFQNIVSNAIKFRKKEEPLLITIEAKEQINCWQVSIQDNGIGIEKQYLEQIFDPFKKLHTRQEYSGTGIGLATCRKIVEAHKGEIWVESTIHEGTCFYFTIAKNLNQENKNSGLLNKVG